MVQLFESWALNIDEVAFRDWVIEPNRRIVEGVRKLVPNAPIIGFRAARPAICRPMPRRPASTSSASTTPPRWPSPQTLPSQLGVQGNLDPLRLLAGGEQMERRIIEIVTAFRNRPHIFNLGHGILPPTPIAHVEKLIETVRKAT